MTLLHVVPLLFAKAMALAVTRLDSPALTTALETGSKAFFPLRVKTRAIALAMAIFAAPTDPFVWIEGPDRRVDDRSDPGPHPLRMCGPKLCGQIAQCGTRKLGNLLAEEGLVHVRWCFGILRERKKKSCAKDDSGQTGKINQPRPGLRGGRRSLALPHGDSLPVRRNETSSERAVSPQYQFFSQGQTLKDFPERFRHFQSQ